MSIFAFLKFFIMREKEEDFNVDFLDPERVKRPKKRSRVARSCVTFTHQKAAKTVAVKVSYRNAVPLVYLFAIAHTEPCNCIWSHHGTSDPLDFEKE